MTAANKSPAVTGWFDHIEIDDRGTIVTFRLISDEGRAWWEEHCGEPERWQMMGSRICIDHRVAGPIAERITEHWPIAYHK